MPLTKRKLKRLALMPVKAAINRIDLVKIWSKMTQWEPGRSWVERTGPPEPAFLDQEDIILRTVEMTAADLAAKGEKASLKEIEEYARSISCRYDFDLHQMGKASVFTLLAHLFEQEDIDRIFLSEDRRELVYFDTLLKARQDGLGIVYLINHTSHWDEFITILTLEQQGITMPLFAAGSNMMATPSLERILMTGSYLIIRKGATKNYLATLYQYCRSLAEMGKQQGIFLEAWAGGARTRDGSLRYPRRLVTLQGALASEKDVLIQPLVISYSAVPEDLSLSEGLGAKNWLNGMPLLRRLLRYPHRPKKAIGQAFHNLWGRAYINFCRPRLLSELDEMRAQDPSDLSRDEFVALYSMGEIARDKKIMASQLTARGILRTRVKGDDLTTATRAELDDLIEYHRRTFGQEPDVEDYIRRNDLEAVIEDGLKTLARRKVIKVKRKTSGRFKVRHENALHYYATHGDRRLYSPSAKENIVVVGAGAWGYGWACLVGQRILEEKRYNSSLTLFDARDDLITSLIETRVHPIHFPKIRLPKNVFPSSDTMAAFRKATDVLVTTSVDLLETDVRHLLTEAQQPLNLIIATRGFEQTTHRLPIQVAQAVAGDLKRFDVSLYVISGPVTPRKLAEGLGGALVLAGAPSEAPGLAELFKWTNFDVFICDDPIGVQLAGTMVEVYSLLGSYLLRIKEMSGRGQIASFIRETSEEVIRMALAMGGRRETFLPSNPAWAAEYVAAGMGGPSAAFGRQAGRSLSRARVTARDFLQDESRDLREEGWQYIGYTAIRSAYLTAKNLNVEMPRLRQAYRIFWRDDSGDEV